MADLTASAGYVRAKHHRGRFSRPGSTGGQEAGEWPATRIRVKADHRWCRVVGDVRRPGPCCGEASTVTVCFEAVEDQIQAELELVGVVAVGSGDVLSGVYALTVVAGAFGEWSYYLLGSAIEVALLMAIVYYAWTWPKTAGTSPTGQEATLHNLPPIAR